MPAKKDPGSSKAASSDKAQLVAIWQQMAPDAVASEAIYATLRQAILKGVLRAGERLGEIHLGSLFNRSRTPVREAILRLEAERLAERTTRRGFVVGSISREEVLEVYTVRETLDGLAARLAAHGILPTELEHLRWLNAQAREAASRQQYDRMLDLHLEFHELVAGASRNSVLVQLIRQIHDRVRRFPTTTFTHHRRAPQALDEHEELLKALGARDADAAERVARNHMARAMQVRIAMLQQDEHGRARALAPGRR